MKEQEVYLGITEYASLDDAMIHATETRKEFSGHDLRTKIAIIKKCHRFFVDEDGVLWYVFRVPKENVNFLHRASAASVLSNGLFEYVQIMVLPEKNEGALRFSGQYGDRKWACENSDKNMIFCFYKK